MLVNLTVYRIEGAGLSAAFCPGFSQPGNQFYSALFNRKTDGIRLRDFRYQWTIDAGWAQGHQFNKRGGNTQWYLFFENFGWRRSWFF